MRWGDQRRCTGALRPVATTGGRSELYYAAGQRDAPLACFRFCPVASARRLAGRAQTANVVLFAMAVGSGRWLGAVYLLLPISAYLSGSFLSEWLGKSVKRLNLLRWDTILVALEVAMVVFLALMPASWPDQVCQVTLNFTCAMQFNTYRQVEGVPAAITFVTNHIR